MGVQSRASLLYASASSAFLFPIHRPCTPFLFLQPRSRTVHAGRVTVDADDDDHGTAWTSRRAQSSQHPLALAASLRSLGLPPSFARVPLRYRVARRLRLRSSSLSCSRSRLSRYLTPRRRLPNTSIQNTNHRFPFKLFTLRPPSTMLRKSRSPSPLSLARRTSRLQDADQDQQRCTCQAEEGQEARDGDLVPARRRARTQGPCCERVQEEQGVARVTLVPVLELAVRVCLFLFSLFANARTCSCERDDDRR
ncbi:hypothetical protein EXIGLDRAFT_58428 [Exidia glandulosa HHB12029]|uniref:Uncharacterized protein n=1 Tax=Exidia glandulosa HHB12029 TaxID=1314781 RepID=A0A165I6U0_EXIGL|nr:hypothetical protein EXIGLDRAFT_58428 [Exidia glandulosa HHB12029]